MRKKDLLVKILKRVEVEPDEKEKSCDCLKGCLDLDCLSALRREKSF